jgi:histidyl-tRNA synthetase
MKFKPPRGTRDYLPEEMVRRRNVFEKIRKVFESYGYGEVCTPAFEDFKLLAKKSGPEIEKEIYAFEDKGGRKLGLRFDPTVPICRIVASNPSLPKPIKFYYITRMWRYDRPQAGRWREFWQAGVELIGSKKPEADAEILAVVYDSLRAVGIKNFYFRINSRNVVEDFIKKSGIPAEKKFDAFRAVDKMGKIGEVGVKKEMKDCGIPAKKISEFLKLIKLGHASKKEIAGLECIKQSAEKIGVRNIEIDFSIVRGIDYYTGFVFETFVKGYEGLGSVASGGRYDDLIGIYGGENLPATGFGIGLDRLMEIIKTKEKYMPTDVYVALVNENIRENAIQIAQILRKNNIKAEVDLMGRSLSKQLEYANAKNIPYCIIIGPQELKQKKIRLRDMVSGQEKIGKIGDIVKEIRKNINRKIY